MLQGRSDNFDGKTGLNEEVASEAATNTMCGKLKQIGPLSHLLSAVESYGPASYLY